jgi:biotin transport system ATP-binding protein
MPSAVTLVNVSKRFPAPDSPAGIFTALDEVSFNLESGSLSLICGANGSGKSLLMSIIAGLEPPSSGSVYTSGRVGLVFQDPDSQILGETPREDIAFGAGNFPKKKIAETVVKKSVT